MLARSIRRACFRLPTTPRVHNPTCVAPSCACAAHLAPPRGPRPSRARPGQRNGSPKKFSPAQAKPDAFIYLFFYVKICIPARPGPGQHQQPKIKTAACICDKLVTFVLVDAHIKLRTLTFKKKKLRTLILGQTEVTELYTRVRKILELCQRRHQTGTRMSHTCGLRQLHCFSCKVLQPNRAR